VPVYDLQSTTTVDAYQQELRGDLRPLHDPDAQEELFWGSKPQLYVLLTQIEEAFKNLKGDLAVRPIFHQLEERIEAHIFVAFLAFCLHATLCHKLRLRAPGLTPRSVLEQLSAIQMLDVHFPTTREALAAQPDFASPSVTTANRLGGIAR